MTAPSIPEPQSIRQAWAEYIIRLPEIVGQPYEYWGTLTYRKAEEIPAHHAQDIVERRFRYFAKEINSRIYGKRWERNGKGIYGAIATEKHLSGYPHHHFIMGGAGLRAGIRRLDIMDLWEKLWGYARCQDYRGAAAARYITKYVSKGGAIDVYGVKGNTKS